MVPNQSRLQFLFPAPVCSLFVRWFITICLQSALIFQRLFALRSPPPSTSISSSCFIIAILCRRRVCSVYCWIIKFSHKFIIIVARDVFNFLWQRQTHTHTVSTHSFTHSHTHSQSICVFAWKGRQGRQSIKIGERASCSLTFVGHCPIHLNSFVSLVDKWRRQRQKLKLN